LVDLPTPGAPGSGTLATVNSSVLGRDHERGQLTGFLSGTGPGLLLIHGVPGIGKTTLCALGTDLARADGYRVVSFRPGEAEAALSFAGLAGLFTDPVLDEVRPALPGARWAALATALARDDRESGTAEPGLVGLGVLSGLTALADAGGRLLIVIDDVQWLDAATVYALDFALRRLGDDAPVRLLAAGRSEDIAGGAPLEDAFAEIRRSRLRLGPMSVGALGRLVQDRLGLVLPRLAAVQLAEESGGNPLVALELARAAMDRGTHPGPGERFLPTADVLTLLGTRIDAVTGEAAEALRIVAAAARPDLALLSRLLGEEPAENAVAGLLAAQLVVLDSTAVRCAHPLVASAAYARILPSARRRLHRALADAVGDPEERSRHLALSIDGPNEDVAAALDEAAATAARRGASTAAAQLAELAVGATARDEPDRLARRELDLARRRLEAGDPAGARDAAVRSLDRLPPGPDRVGTLLLLSAVEQERAELADSRRWIVQALEEAGTDRAALARAHVTAGMTAWEDVETERAHAAAAVRALAGHEDDDPTSAATALVLLAGTDFEAGLGLAVDLLDRAVELEPHTDLVAMMRPSTQRAVFLGHAGRLSEALPAIADCIAAGERQGDQTSRPHLLRTLAWMQLGAGRLSEARATIEQAMAAADELALDDAYILAVAGQIHATLGLTGSATTLCDRALQRAREAGNPWAEIRALAAGGFLRLTSERAGDAAEALTAADAIVSAGRLVEIGWHRMHGDLVEALATAGRSAEADAAARLFRERAVQTGHPWSLAVSARALGLVATGAGRFEDATQECEESLASHGMAEMPFERARTLLVLGAARRRANRRRSAREALDEAGALFEKLGSGPWAARARAEAGTISGRTAGSEDLTAMQRRVAALAAVGRTNAEIAQELYLSVRTVEAHLAAVYRKLGARSRTELAAIFR
jgi:DNA-binding CsgD family transcriptional regulator